MKEAQNSNSQYDHSINSHKTDLVGIFFIMFLRALICSVMESSLCECSGTKDQFLDILAVQIHCFC